MLMDWLVLPIFLAACLAASSTGALFMPDRWYREELAKPPWTPPDWMFPVVWLPVYLIIAIAAARAASLPGNDVALAFWSLQMVLNALWSPVFFGLRRVGAGLVIVLCLWAAVCATMVALFQLDTIAGLLFVPYLTWVTV